MIDFTNCQRIMGKAYNGVNSKIAVEYARYQYMLKFPSAEKNARTNSCISEHIASSIFHMLGIKAQQTQIGTYTVNGKTKIVCACQDFTANGKTLYDFCSVINTVVDSKHTGNGTELDDLLETIEKQQYIPPHILLEHFWDMFIADALLGNSNRHDGNWGLVYDKVSQCAEIAPVFACGSCLRHDQPASAIKQNGTKINYYDFLTGNDSKDANAAVLRIVPRVNLAEIADFIDHAPLITEEQKEFYKMYIAARFEKILVPAYENALTLSQDGQAFSPTL